MARARLRGEGQVRGRRRFCDEQRGNDRRETWTATCRSCCGRRWSGDVAGSGGLADAGARRGFWCAVS